MLVAILGAGMLVQVVALDTAELDRSADIGAPDDGEALLGVELADSVAVGQSCEFGPDAIDVEELEAADGDINSTRDVVIDDDIDFEYSLETTGCVRLEGGNSGIDLEIEGSFAAGGDVIVEDRNNDLDIEGPFAAGGISIAGNNNDIEIEDEFTVSGPVTIDGNQNDLEIEGSVTTVGSITVDGNQNDLEIDGPATVGGTITIDGDENDLEIEGSVEENADVEPPEIDPPDAPPGGTDSQRLVTTTNQAGTDLDVTVTLEDPTAGKLQAGTSGAEVSFRLVQDGSRTVEFEPAADLDGPVTVGITAAGAGEADPLTVELFRTVPTG